MRERLHLGEDREGTVTTVSVFEHGAAVSRPAVATGQIARLSGLRDVRVGDAIGAARSVRRADFAPPTMETAVVPRDPTRRAALHTALAQLAEQDPLINLRQDDERGVAHLSLYGEVQKEVIAQTIAAEAGIEIEFLETTTICVERVVGVGHAVERLGQPPNRYLATVGLCVEPAEVGEGVEVMLDVDLVTIPLYIYKTVDAFRESMRDYVGATLQRGPSGWAVPDCRVTLTECAYDSPSSSARDFRKLTTIVLRTAVREAGTVVCEPIDRFHLDAPAESLSGVLQLLAAPSRDSRAACDLGRVALTRRRDPRVRGPPASTAPARTHPRGGDARSDVRSVRTAMTHTRMHDDELDIDIPLVRRLIRAQHPQWGDLAIERLVSSGTDNAMFRLGDDMVVRMPRIERAVAALANENRWLPVLAPQLPLAVPTPLASGSADESYPWEWSVYSWLEGANAFDGRIDDLGQAARDLAEFIRALQAIDTTDTPPPGRGRRGVPLAAVDQQTRRAIEAAGELVDTEAVTAAWDAALREATWRRDPVWVHGDIARGNLLVRGGRTRAVIDFGCSGVGDPACDLIVAWDLFDEDSRAVFREAVGLDDATWARGRGWALCTALWALPYYLHTNPVMVAQARHKIAEVLADTA